MGKVLYQSVMQIAQGAIKKRSIISYNNNGIDDDFIVNNADESEANQAIYNNLADLCNSLLLEESITCAIIQAGNNKEYPKRIISRWSDSIEDQVVVLYNELTADQKATFDAYETWCNTLLSA